MTKVFIDLDGTLANFSKGLKEYGLSQSTEFQKPRETWTEAEVAHDKLVQRAMAVPGFFRRLPPIPGYKELWNVAGKDRYILTALPQNDKTAARVKAEKKGWVDFYLGNVPGYRFIACRRAEKKKYAPGNILVDDLIRNCDEWLEAGGVAILFKNNLQAVIDLRKIV